MPSNERTIMAKMAERSGASLSTLSAVLCDMPGGVSSMRQWILEVAWNPVSTPPKPTLTRHACLDDYHLDPETEARIPSPVSLTHR